MWWHLAAEVSDLAGGGAVGGSTEWVIVISLGSLALLQGVMLRW